MPNYHLDISNISRGKKKRNSVTGAASYICGRTLRDSYRNQMHYNPRKDVVWQKIFLPDSAPPEFRGLQHLCDEIEHNFLPYGLCAIAAIHRGRNRDDPLRSNPHAHIIVPTRPVGEDGFRERKDREHDKRKYITIWREQWAEVQNRAYERNRLDIRVSHESLAVQGIDREPMNHLSRIDWQREQSGERTLAGDKRRAIKAHNKERSCEHQPEQEHEFDIGLSR